MKKIYFNRKPKYLDKKTKIPVFEQQKTNLNEFSIQNADKIHDNALKWLFDTHYETEKNFRKKLIKKLNLKKGNSILVTGAGSGNDLTYILDKIGPNGIIFIQDYAKEMLIAGFKKIKKKKKY